MPYGSVTASGGQKYGKLKLKLKCRRKIGLLVVGREVRQIGSAVKNAV